jgi:hypothetical protein
VAVAGAVALGVLGKLKTEGLSVLPPFVAVAGVASNSVTAVVGLWHLFGIV